MTQILITPASGAPTADALVRRFLMHLAHDPAALVAEIQTPTADLVGRDWLVTDCLEGSGWATAGPVERTNEGWQVDVVAVG